MQTCPYTAGGGAFRTQQAECGPELGELVTPPLLVSGGAFFSRHGVWRLSSVEEAGAGEVTWRKMYFGWYSPTLAAKSWMVMEQARFLK